ncbi:MAG TPA: methyltransferase domain-containing protein [Chloroflexota bacterium]|jgi:ubiquinone/menaquinone biosynthesis C-methylase UbiE|nr:methyltransferase domain-containing protein [Chloroflexota bacterium]
MTQEAEHRKAQTTAGFNRLAPVYDAAGVGCFAHFGQKLIDSIGVEPGQTVLDVATGRGAVLFPAAERVGPTGQVTGVDLAEAMVEATRAEAERRKLAVDVRVMDAEHLTFSNKRFDRVLCGFGLMFFPNLDQALSDMQRVLKPNGRLGVSTWQISQADDLRAVLDDLGLGGPGEPGWITAPDALARLLIDAGFKNVEVQVATNTFHYADLTQYWQNARGTGLSRRLAALDTEQTDRARAVLAERLRPYQRSDGLYVDASALLGLGSAT